MHHCLHELRCFLLLTGLSSTRLFDHPQAVGLIHRNGDVHAVMGYFYGRRERSACQAKVLTKNSTVMGPNNIQYYAIGVDIGSTVTKFGIVNHRGEITKRGIDLPTKKFEKVSD